MKKKQRKPLWVRILAILLTVLVASGAVSYLVVLCINLFS